MICSKCKSVFTCKKEDIHNCHCNIFHFNKKTKNIIKANYNNCLCNNCLKKFVYFQKLELEEILINGEINLIEGLHYTIENTLWVFSEYYHYLKGKCCNNNCKNCIYS